MNHKLTIVSDADMFEVAAQLQRQVRESASDPNVISLAVVAASSHPDDIIGIHQFVRATFPYDNDPDILADRYGLYFPADYELFTAPWVMARDYFDGIALKEDCDSLNSLVATLNASLGYQVRIKLVDVSGDGDLDHLLSEVFHPIHNRWLVVDVTTEFPVLWDEIYYKNILVEI